MTVKKRKVLYISGTRADYGLVKATLLCIKNNPKLKLEIIATGMHLMPEFGKTINEIKKDGFKIHRIPATYEKDNKESMAIFMGNFTRLLTEKIGEIKPDIILVLGDRAEMLAAAIVASCLSIPVAHIHGGEISSTIYDNFRHAITKFSNIHFPVTKKSGERIIKMGEDPWRVHVIGAPGLDDVLQSKIVSPQDIAKKYNLDPAKPILIVVQHPVTIETNLAKKHMNSTMSAVKELGYEAIIIYPNADAGGRGIIKVIEKYRKFPFIKIYKNIPRADYLSLLNIADAVVGNSSSGILETPYFHLPTVNIGTRQLGRERAENVIDVGYKKEDIKKAIQKALFDATFKAKAKKCANPYGGKEMAGPKVTKVISRVKVNSKLLQKRLSY